MKFKTLCINFIIVLLSSYLPLLGYSYFSYSRNQRVFNRKYEFKNDFERRKDKINAVNNGLLPTYHPIRLVLENEDSLEIFPIGSLPFTNSFYCDEGYGLTTFKTDRFGLRNAENKWENLLDKSNIFVLGDSFTHGACIENDQTIPSIIEKKTNINTINLGMGGNGPYNYHATLKLLVKPIIKKTKTKNIVLLNFYADDFYSPNYYREEFHKKNLKLLDNSKSIIKISKNKSVLPKEEYKENLRTFIKDKYPISKEEMITQIIKPKQINKTFKHTFFYQIFSLFMIFMKI